MPRKKLISVGQIIAGPDEVIEPGTVMAEIDEKEKIDSDIQKLIDRGVVRVGLVEDEESEEEAEEGGDGKATAKKSKSSK